MKQLLFVVLLIALATTLWRNHQLRVTVEDQTALIWEFEHWEEGR